MMKSFLKSFSKTTVFKRQWCDYLLVMTKKEIKSKYKNTTLGFLWIFVNPLLQMLVIGFIFKFFIPIDVDNYFLFLFTGILPWNFFSYSITQATSSIVNERDLVKKSNLNREIIVLSIVLSNMFHFLASLFLLVVFLIISELFSETSAFGLIQYVFSFIGAIPYLVWILLLTASLALLFSAMNVKFRDLNFIVRSLVPLWFYITPITYSLNLLPNNLRMFLYLNPITPIIEGFHSILAGAPVASKELVVIHVLIMLLLLLISILYFNKESKDFADWV